MTGPSKLLLISESFRGIYEYGLCWLLKAPLKYISPKGDGHPVLILPGLGAADGSTYFLRNFIDDIGYTSFPWGQGRNYGPRHGLEEMSWRLTELVKTIYRTTGNQQVTLIGWSLGGIYSREIAKICPDYVRQVITLGTPFKDIHTATNAKFFYEFLSGDKSLHNPKTIQRISEPPPVPFTSIYSKTDGVVCWESSIEKTCDCSENIEIAGASHSGLIHNPIALFIIANRLTNTKDKWTPYSEK